MTTVLLAASGPTATIYRVVLLVHIAAAIIGFGGVALNGLYAADAMRRSAAERLAVLQANFRVTLVAEKAIYVVLLAGIGLVLLSDGAWSFGQTWVWLSLVLFVVTLGVSHGALIPATRSMIRITRAGPEGKAPADEATLAALGKRASVAGLVLHLLLAVLLVLMIWKPGA